MSSAVRARYDSIREAAVDIKIAHSVFAMPFAVLAAFMAASHESTVINWKIFIVQLVLVMVAMVFARTSAMLSNRILDWRIDAENPRTAARAIPSGRLSLQAAVWCLSASSIAFLFVCLLFFLVDGNPWPLILGLPVLVWVCIYGFFKRFTMLCHIWLGMSLGISPLAATIAVAPDALGAAGPWFLSLMVLCWVAGFDIIYALQDVEVDRKQGLHSAPSRLGNRNALFLSRMLHAVSALALLATWLVSPLLGFVFLACSIAAIMLLVIEQATVHAWGTSRIALTFFTINGLISCLIGLGGVVDIIIAT